MPLGQIKIGSNIRDYSVDFSSSSDLTDSLKTFTPSVFVIDENVWKYHKDGILSSLKKNKNVIILAVNEEKKNLRTVQQLYAALTKLASKKNLTLISIGGGILQDITGFAASTIYRGIKWIFLPTTLLAQADSCIGAKTSLNFGEFKNLIGTFYPPAKIFIYPPFLKTQNDRDYYSGVGEMAKLHLMGGEKDTAEFIQKLRPISERDGSVLLGLTQRSLLIKKSYIEEDEFDSGRRNMLNYGHDFGHAIESATDFAVPHGQAVAIGMVLANIIAKKKDLLSAEKEMEIRQELLLPIIDAKLLKMPLNSSKVISAMQQDKKRTGQGLALVMMKTDHEMIRISDLSTKEAVDALVEYKTLIKG